MAIIESLLPGIGAELGVLLLEFQEKWVLMDSL
jgi:hypothetical protein